MSVQYTKSEKRKVYLSMANRKARSGSGSHPLFLRERSSHYGLPYITLPYLVLMKLAAGRVQNLADITRMLGCANETDLQQTRDILKKYSPRDSEDFESMIQLGKLEYEEQ